MRVTNGSGVRFPYWQATVMRKGTKAIATSRETSYRSDVNEPLEQGNDIEIGKVSRARGAFILQRYVSLSGGTFQTIGARKREAGKCRRKNRKAQKR